MNSKLISALGAIAIISATYAAQSWENEYTGEELTGKGVIACWQFKTGQEMEDNSGHGHNLKLHGEAKIVPDGKFGNALESYGGGSKNDHHQGATIINKDNDLNTNGAICAEMWICPNEAAKTGTGTYFLLDKKLYNYMRDFEKANLGFCLFLTRTSENKYHLHAHLGFKTESKDIESVQLILPPNEWHHIAFSYSGNGIVRLFMDGKKIGSATLQGYGPLATSNYQTTIGDRTGSTYNSFPGKISQVRICSEIPEAFAGKPELTFSMGRTVFYRMEKNASVTMKIINDSDAPLSNAKITTTANGKDAKFEIPFIAAHDSVSKTVQIDSTLKPGAYTIEAKGTATQNEKEIEFSNNLTYNIVYRENKFMPVVMWGSGDIESLKYIGFTHDLRGYSNAPDVWKAEKPIDLSTVGDVSGPFDLLNRYMLEGLHVCLTTRPGPWVGNAHKDVLEYHRVDRNGEPKSTQNIAASHPKIQQFGYNHGASVAKTYLQFPNYDAALIHSEIRDNTDLSFHDFEVKAAERYLGCKIPDEAIAKSGVPYISLPNFPRDCVIEDDNTILRFYKWFWKEGDGWNPLHSQIHKGLKSSGRKDFWTFFDPAVRVPSLWGSGGDVDIISQWTYSYPDPIKIGQAADELFAMAEGKSGQQVMKMTQIIWYRSQTAPIDRMDKDESKRLEWEKRLPDAQFITISPDHLSEAFWSMIARPVRGIMYHGWGSLFESKVGSYRHTNPNTAKRLSKLVHEVIQPLGPMLLEVPDYNTEVAVLESFASQMFTQCGTSGWSNSWEADMHLILQWAGYQPRIIYDETILKNGLDNYKVLAMPKCKVLTRSVFEAIKKFQARGGIIIADENICPAIIPDIFIPVHDRKRKADIDKAELQKLAKELRNKLDPFYRSPFRTENQDIVMRLRKYGTSDYLFVINDKRTFGDYLGKYELVMEQGVENEGFFYLKRNGGYAYDLLKNKPLKFERKNGNVIIKAKFAPGEGKLLLFMDTALEKISTTLPNTVKRGTDVPFTTLVTNSAGRTPNAVIPLQITIKKPNGELGEFSGYHAAKEGKLDLVLNLASNEPEGKWSFTVKDLASGNVSSMIFNVN